MEHSCPPFVIIDEFTKLLCEIAELKFENSRLTEATANSGLRDYKVDKSSNTNMQISKMAPEMLPVLSNVLERIK